MMMKHDEEESQEEQGEPHKEDSDGTEKEESDSVQSCIACKKCGSVSHRRSNHRDCPHNTRAHQHKLRERDMVEMVEEERG